MANYTPDKLKVSKNGNNYIYDFAAKMNASLKGAANGVAELDANGKVPTAQLPSYVDDVVDGYYYNGRFYEESTHTTEITGESGKIYVDLDTNKTYRWSGSAFVVIASDLALGETSSTAYRGDRGKTAYDHATDASRLTTAQTSGLYKIATTAEGHVAGVTTVAKSDITALGIPAQDTTYSDFVGATSQEAGESGLVPAPTTADADKYLKGDGTWSAVDALPTVTSSDNEKVLEVVDGEWSVGNEKIDKQYDMDLRDISTKTWTGLTSFYGYSVWTDGENIYYSSGTNQYILDKSTSTWTEKTWTGLTNFSGNRIWTDGENIYYSYSTNQYILDKSTSTWTEKTWTGLTNFAGNNIWTDGENIYFSSGSNQKILDKSTSTWSDKSWNGLTNFSRSNIWTDGQNIYYSFGTENDQYILDKSTSTWSTKTWFGLTNPYGSDVWTDGENIYYSSDTYHQILDKSTSTWFTKTWAGSANPSFAGSSVWTDGENYYSSYESTQYVFGKSYANKILLGRNGEFSPVDTEYYLDSKADKTDTVLNTTLSLGRKANTTVGTNSTALGYNVEASSSYSHAEGNQTTASNSASHAEGRYTKATGASAHAEGYYTNASGANSHAEGIGDSSNQTSYGALGKADHAEGYLTKANSGTWSNYYGAHAEGYQTTASSQAAHAEGYNTTASGYVSHAQGYNTIASGSYAHTEGYETTASSSYAHAQGYYTTASSQAAHAEGGYSKAKGDYSHAAGIYTDAQGCAQFVFGSRNVPFGSETITLPTLENVEPYDPTKKEYPRGSVVKVGDTIYVAHNVANVKRAAPNYDTVNWHQYTGTLPAEPAYWSTDVLYNQNDIVKVNVNGTNTYYQYHSANMQYVYIVPGAGADGSINWHVQDAGSNYTDAYGKYVEIVGNGALYTAGTNIRALGWDGNQYLKGDLYVNCDADSTGGTKVTPLPSAPVSDGTYILQCTVSSGTATYSWVSLPAASGVSF